MMPQKGQITKHECILGDCLEAMKRIPDNSIDMVFTDMPYGTTKNKWDIVIDLGAWWLEVKRIRKPGAAIVLTCQFPFTAVLAMSNKEELRYDWVYQKTLPTGHLNAKKMPMKLHENVLVFYDILPVYNPIKTTGHKRKVSMSHHNVSGKGSDNYGVYGNSSYDSTERYPLSIQVFKSDRQKSALNSTQKPVALVEYFIRTYSNPGDVILDTCAGSGTTGVAAYNTGRSSVLIEIDPAEYQKCITRQTKEDGIQKQSGGKKDL